MNKLRILGSAVWHLSIAAIAISIVALASAMIDGIKEQTITRIYVQPIVISSDRVARKYIDSISGLVNKGDTLAGDEKKWKKRDREKNLPQPQQGK